MDFSVEGTGEYDFWLVNGSRDFAIIPKNTIKDLPYDLPVRLQVGFQLGKNQGFGESHIKFKRGSWIQQQKLSIPEFIYMKLGQSGDIYCTEEENKKKVNLSFHPSTLLLLRYIPKGKDSFLTVVTLYKPESRLDGEKVGRYQSAFRHIF